LVSIVETVPWAVARRPFVRDLIEFPGDGSVIVHGIGRPKRIELPEEVIEWLKRSYAAKRILEEAVTHYKFRQRLAHPGAIRSLLLLLYARRHGIAPYRLAKKYGVAAEQLYRLERGLKKDGMYEFVINSLSLEAEEASSRVVEGRQEAGNR
jgi:hypothetical protein